MAKRKIGILTGGGDCPGLNTVIASIVKVGVAEGFEFVGFERGWEGLLDPMTYIDLDTETVKGISYLGGTILKTTNKGRFSGKVGKGDTADIPSDILEEAKNNLASLGVDGLVVIGGDGTLSGAEQLSKHGVKIIGVPKTIDNDIVSTDKSFGFSSAVEVVVDALDKIHTTATSHERTFIVECMGRNTGWITLAAGLAGGANAILIPEFDFSVGNLVSHIRGRLERQHRSTIIAIAEGARVNGQTAYSDRSQKGEVRYSGISEVLMHAIESSAPGEFELRNVILGHTQRGSGPNAEDRTLSKRYGVAAIDAYKKEQFGNTVCIKSGQVFVCPLEEASKEVKRVSQATFEYYVASRLGIFIH